MKLTIKKMIWCRGRLSMLPFRVFNEEGLIVRAFSSRMEAEDYISMMKLKERQDEKSIRQA